MFRSELDDVNGNTVQEDEENNGYSFGYDAPYIPRRQSGSNYYNLQRT
jgi:hypothetical protein